MKVFRIGNSEVSIIEEALDYLGGTYNGMIKVEQDKKIKEEMEYKEAHIRTTIKLLQDQRLQELCERCLSYFWDMYKEMGGFCDLLEELIDDMGLDEEELVELFHEAGFEEE